MQMGCNRPDGQGQLCSLVKVLRCYQEYATFWDRPSVVVDAGASITELTVRCGLILVINATMIQFTDCCTGLDNVMHYPVLKGGF